MRPRSERGVLIGHAMDASVYIVHLPRLNKNVTSSAVVFDDIPAEEPFLTRRPDHWVSPAPGIDDAAHEEQEAIEERRANDYGGVGPSIYDGRDTPRPRKSTQREISPTGSTEDKDPVEMGEEVKQIEHPEPTERNVQDSHRKAMPGQLLSMCSHRVYNDEATAWLIWSVMAKHHKLDFMGLMLLDDTELKTLSNDVKSMGVLGCDSGHLLVEMVTMRGRGVEPVSWRDEMLKRVDPETQSMGFAPFSAADITRAVREVVRDELPCKPTFVDRDTAFAYRFATTRGGSHSAVGSVIGRTFCDPLPKCELTRRHFVESLHSNPLMQTPAGAWVSRSEKLEHGKTRALFACDTLNYLHFDAPCRAVEAAWLNNRANLNPAGEGVTTEYEKRAAWLCAYKVMFDFTDFNSAHTLESQKCVVREVFAGLDHEWLDWMLRSIDWMWIRQDDDTWRHVTGTLMSGHRLTSLINTVLNAAYTRLALGEALYSRITVEHVGDDIVMSTDCADTITDTVTAMLQSGLRLQVDKQSCGEINAEFLRNCYNGAVCLGYVCRSVASLVSGSWVSENALGTREYAQSLYTALWNTNNRSLGVSRVGLVAVSNCMRRVGLSRSNAESFCTQRCVIGSGPAMLGDGPLIRITFFEFIQYGYTLISRLGPH